MKKYILVATAIVALVAYIRTNRGTSAIAHSPRTVTAPQSTQKGTEKPEAVVLELSNINLNFNPKRT